MSDVLKVDIDGAVATFTLNRPEAMNAFSDELKADLRREVGRINDNDAVRVVILKGAGRGFGAGADLTGGMDPISFHLDIDYKPFLTGIERSDKIWIAQVHGAAAGAAAGLAMTCDFVVMAEDAYLYMAFAAIGLVPDGGNTHLLFQQMGYRHALEAVLEGKKFTAAECLDYRIANKVVPLEDLESVTREFADRIAATAPLAMAGCKRLLRKAGTMSFGEAVTEEGIEQTALLKTEDFREGVKAFFEKRKPVWQGK